MVREEKGRLPCGRPGFFMTGWNTGQTPAQDTSVSAVLSVFHPVIKSVGFLLLFFDNPHTGSPDYQEYTCQNQHVHFRRHMPRRGEYFQDDAP